MYDELVAKLNRIDTSAFVLKTRYDTDKSKWKINFLILLVLLKKPDCNAKITQIEGKIQSISGLTTNAVLTTVENKIPNINSLVNKTDYNTKIAED